MVALVHFSVNCCISNNRRDKKVSWNLINNVLSQMFEENRLKFYIQNERLERNWNFTEKKL